MNWQDVGIAELSSDYIGYATSSQFDAIYFNKASPVDPVNNKWANCDKGLASTSWGIIDWPDFFPFFSPFFWTRLSQKRA